MGNCNEDSDAVQNAKSLPPKVLLGLINEVQVLLEEFSPLTLPKISDMPKHIRSLSPKHVNSHGGKELWIYLHTCTPDSKVILYVDAGEGKITVSWGDWGSKKSGSDVLWPKT